MTIELQLENTRYDGFKEISIVRDIENCSGTFKFVTSVLNAFPVERGQKCVALINKRPVITGFIDSIEISYDGTTHKITISGRDKLADIVDSTIDSTSIFSTPITLENVIRKILDNLNMHDVKIINQVGSIPAFGKEDLVCGRLGQAAWDFISDYASKRAVLVSTDGLGNIILSRGEGKVIGASLINVKGGFSNNIKSANVTYDDSKRFHHYILKSQENLSADLGDLDLDDDSDDDSPNIDGRQVVSVKGESFDENIRISRVMVMNAEKSSRVADTINRAQWERDMRRARAIKYQATVVGHEYSFGGDIWEPLQVVNVTDLFCNVNDDLIIRKIEYKLDLDGGEVTVIDLVPKETFKLESEESEKKAKKNKSKGEGISAADIAAFKQEFGLK